MPYPGLVSQTSAFSIPLFFLASYPPLPSQMHPLSSSSRHRAAASPTHEERDSAPCLPPGHGRHSLWPSGQPAGSTRSSLQNLENVGRLPADWQNGKLAERQNSRQSLIFCTLSLIRVQQLVSTSDCAQNQIWNLMCQMVAMSVGEAPIWSLIGCVFHLLEEAKCRVNACGDALLGSRAHPTLLCMKEETAAGRDRNLVSGL